MTRKVNESSRLVRLFTKKSWTYPAKGVGKEQGHPQDTPTRWDIWVYPPAVLCSASTQAGLSARPQCKGQDLLLVIREDKAGRCARRLWVLPK